MSKDRSPSSRGQRTSSKRSSGGGSKKGGSTRGKGQGARGGSAGSTRGKGQGARGGSAGSTRGEGQGARGGSAGSTGQGSGKRRSSPSGPSGKGSTGSSRPPSGRAAQWGSLARKGAQRASEPDERPPRSPAEPLTEEEQARRLERQARRDERAANQARLRSEAKDAVERADAPARSRRRSPARTDRRDLPPVPLSLDEPEVAITRLVGAERAPRYVDALRAASQAFARERYHDARRALAPALDAVPDVAEVAELQGLIQYRLGNWKAAAVQLERFRALAGTTEQHPVLADCYRAQRRYRDVDELWDELREASPSADLVTEGRIVTAGARADQGDLTGAIELLERGWTRPKRPKPHHLRRAYALADLYERSGRAPRARELFRWIQSKDVGFADVDRRVAAL